MSKEIQLWDKTFPAFDDYIIGKHVKVCYTHHEPPEDGEIGAPLFLCFDEKGKSLPMYIVGHANARDWIREVDARIDARNT